VGKALLIVVVIFGAFAWLGIGGWMMQALPLGPVGLIAVIATFNAPAVSSIGRRFGLLLAKRAGRTEPAGT